MLVCHSKHVNASNNGDQTEEDHLGKLNPVKPSSKSAVSKSLKLSSKPRSATSKSPLKVVPSRHAKMKHRYIKPHAVSHITSEMQDRDPDNGSNDDEQDEAPDVPVFRNSVTSKSCFSSRPTKKCYFYIESSLEKESTVQGAAEVPIKEEDDTAGNGQHGEAPANTLDSEQSIAQEAGADGQQVPLTLMTSEKSQPEDNDEGDPPTLALRSHQKKVYSVPKHPILVKSLLTIEKGTWMMGMACERKKWEQEGTYDPDEPDSPSDESESSPRHITPVSSSKARKCPAKRTSAALPASLDVQGADCSLSSSKPKGGAPSTEAHRTIQEFAEKVNADAEVLSKELGLRKVTVMMNAGFSTKATCDGDQNWNHHQSCFAETQETYHERQSEHSSANLPYTMQACPDLSSLYSLYSLYRYVSDWGGLVVQGLYTVGLYNTVIHRPLVHTIKD
ncbi:hypothetical protein BU15DRAFT_68886 [Melanogaster broomeanus]|nr:hypothetical protein BU15DRAFT_68886 [Melanogaster broomeanus]